MTCIAAVVEDGRVWMGSDAAISWGNEIVIAAGTKVSATPTFIVGGTGDCRISQLLHYGFEPPVLENGYSLEWYFTNTFPNALRDCLKAGGAAKRENEAESHGNTFLVGFRGRLFRLACDYAWTEATWGYNAVGCGGEIALGVLYATQGRPPEERIRTALEAAERHSAGVRGPFTILSTL